MTKYAEIRTNHIEEVNNKKDILYVDAWKSNDENEEGSVIAKIISHQIEEKLIITVEYLDEDAKKDEYAIESIKEGIETLKGCHPNKNVEVYQYYYVTDLGNVISLTESILKVLTADTINWIVNEKEYELDKLTTEFVCQDITGHVSELSEEQFSPEARKVVDAVLKKMQEGTFDFEKETGLDKKMLETEMEKYLIENDINILGDEAKIDSALVIKNAINLGFESFILDNNLSELHESLMFIRK